MANPPLRAPGGFRSVTTRIIFWVLLASGAVFLTAVAVSSRLSRSTAEGAAEQEAQNAADAARHRVLAVLEAVEKTTALLSASIETLHPAAPSLDELLHRFVAGNLNVYGSTAFVRACTPSMRVASARRRTSIAISRSQVGI